MKLRTVFAMFAVVALSLGAFAAQNGDTSETDVIRITDMPEYIASSSYIFVFDDKVEYKMPVKQMATELAKTYRGEVRHSYSHIIRGFSARMSAEDAQRMFEDNPDIKYYEPNGVCYAIGKPPWAGGGDDEEPPSGQEIPWGISRVGGGVAGNFCTAWIIDSGVDYDHPDLNVDTTRSIAFVRSKNGGDDDNGHGTHVAGTIAAIDNNIDVIGVAPGATVVAVKVLDRRGSGTWDAVLAGIDYVAQHAASCDVANMSLGGGYSQALNDAVENAARTCAFTLAAGNESMDANLTSPASASGPNIYTISAIGTSDVLASFSNYGVPPVDFAEPGVNILSTKKGGGTTTMSGTSMAAPHAAGLLLLGNIRTDGYTNTDPVGDSHPIGVH